MGLTTAFYNFFINIGIMDNGIVAELWTRICASISRLFAQQKPPPPPINTPPLPAERVQAFPTRHERNVISANCLALLQQTLGKAELPEGQPDAAYQELRALVVRIHTLICHPPTKESHLSVCSDFRENLQNMICKALKHSVYQALKTSEKDPLVHFLHIASDIIHNRSEGMSAYEALGKRLLDELGEDQSPSSYTLKEFQQIMDQARTQTSTHNHSSFLGRIGYSIRHPSRVAGTLVSRSPLGLQYNAYDLGNYNAELGKWVIDASSHFRTSAGPNPTHPNYPIFDAVLQLRKNLKRPTHTQMILEGAEGGGAKQRRDVMLAKPNETGHPLHAFALPMDGPPRAGKKAFATVGTSQDFTRELFKERDSLGLVLPEATIAADSVEVTLKHFHNALSHLEGTDTWMKLYDKNELSGTLLLGFDAIFALRYMIHAAANKRACSVQLQKEGYNVDSTCQITCKQGVDRGAVVNILMRILVDAKNRGGFDGITPRQLQQYCGYTFGRALNVDARQIAESRYKFLRNFLNLLSHATPQQQRNFLDDLNLPPDMHFVPSNEQ